MTAIRISAVITIVCLALPIPAWADAAAPYPVRQIDLQVRFENLDDYPEWAFYLVYARHRGAPPKELKGQMIPLTSGQSVSMPGNERRVEAELIAAPRQKAVSVLDEQYLTQVSPDVLRRRLYGLGISETIFFDLNDGYVTPFRVAIAKGELQVELLPVEPVRPEINLGLFKLPVRQSAVFLALCLAVVGIWYAWRRRREKKMARLTGSKAGSPTGGVMRREP